MPTKKTSMRLDEETKKLIELIAKKRGGNHTTIVKQAVRVLARQEGIVLEDK